LLNVSAFISVASAGNLRLTDRILMQLKSVQVIALQMPSRKSCEKEEVAKVDMLHNSQQAIEKPGF
jgi:hypothetical protein